MFNGLLQRCCLLWMLFPVMGHANGDSDVRWESVRAPEGVRSIERWEERGLLARTQDGALWFREDGRDWRALGRLGVHTSVELSADEDQWLDMEALLEEERSVSESSVPGDEDDVVASVVSDVEDGSGILWSRLESSGDEGRVETSSRSRFSQQVVLGGQLYAYGQAGVVRWTQLRWELVSSRPTLRLLLSDDRLVRWGSDGEAQMRAPEGVWTEVPLPSAVAQASAVFGAPGGVFAVSAGGVVQWSPEDETARVMPDFEGSNCLVEGVDGHPWVCHSGALWPLNKMKSPVPLPFAMADNVGATLTADAGSWLAWNEEDVRFREEDAWRSLGKPSEEDIFAATLWGAHIYVADAEGLWRVPLESSGPKHTRSTSVPPLDVLLRAAMKRADVAAGTPSALRAMWLPRVELEGTLRPSTQLTYLPDTGSAGETDRSWGVMARFTWTPPGRTGALPWDGEEGLSGGDRLLFSAGDQRMVVLDQSALPRAVGTTRRASRIRGEEIASRVADLYAQRLGYERDTVYRDVSEAVIAMLEMQTVDALLDVYTEGAYSAWEGEKQ